MKMYLIRICYTIGLFMLAGLILSLLGLATLKIWWLYFIIYIACDYFAKRIYIKQYGIDLLALDFENEKGNFEFVVDYKSNRYLLNGFFPNGFISNKLLKNKLSSKILRDGVNKENLIELLNHQSQQIFINIKYEREVVPLTITFKSVLKKGT